MTNNRLLSNTRALALFSLLAGVAALLLMEAGSDWLYRQLAALSGLSALLTMLSPIHPDNVNQRENHVA